MRARRRNRTGNLLITNQVLFQVELGGRVTSFGSRSRFLLTFGDLMSWFQLVILAVCTRSCPFKGRIEGFAMRSSESIAAADGLSVDPHWERRVLPAALFGDVDRVVPAGVSQRGEGAAQRVRRHALAGGLACCADQGQRP